MPGALGKMLRQSANHYDRRSFASVLRRKRFALFSSMVDRLPKPVRVLDVGGDERFWEEQPEWISVTLLNILAEAGQGRCRSVRGDACFLPFKTAEFDVVFSNSVIEHLGGWENQKRMAEEIRRVGKRYFIQTPSRWFPLEPHFLFPGFQYLPFAWRVWIAAHYEAGWYCHPGDPAAARKEVESIRLLTRRDCADLFPEAAIRIERLLGFAKSYIVIGGWDKNKDSERQCAR